MKAGELNRRIQVQEKTVSRGTSGGESFAWALKVSLWAMAEDKGGKEMVEIEALITTHLINFSVRYRTDLDTEMRIVYATKDYEIISINEIGFKEGLLITTQKIE